MDCHINTPCITCGKLIRKSRTGLCVDCYNKSQQKNISRCKICQKRIRNDSSTGLCLEHYKLIKPPYKRKPTIIIKKSHNKQTRCNKCGKQIRKAGLCSTCLYLENAKRLIEVKKNHEAKLTKTQTDKSGRNYNPSPCLKSPSGYHRWLINSSNIGTCFYCDHSEKMAEIDAKKFIKSYA